MDLFGRRNQPQHPAAPDDNIETVREYLEAIGMSRLHVRNATMKVLLTQIAWNGEDYLIGSSTGGKPSGGQIVALCEQLKVVRNVVDEFIRLETKSDTSDEYLKLTGQAVSSVQEFATAILNVVSKNKSSGSGIGFGVDVELLRRLAQGIK